MGALGKDDPATEMLQNERLTPFRVPAKWLVSKGGSHGRLQNG